MATRTGQDLEDLRALLAEVQALRDDVETKGREMRRDWGAAAEQAASRAPNVSHYLALRSRDLTDFQLKLAARGLSSLGRSEAKVRAALDVLIVTLRRLTGKSDAPIPPADAAPAPRIRPEPTASSAGAPKGAPRTRIMATLPSEAAEDAALVARLVAAGMDCARINCAHDNAGAWERRSPTCASRRRSSTDPARS